MFQKLFSKTKKSSKTQLPSNHAVVKKQDAELDQYVHKPMKTLPATFSSADAPTPVRLDYAIKGR
jgi:hypothetical protein